MSAHDDPRDASLETRLSAPRSWIMGSDAMSSLTMLVCGMVMVTRNRYLAWPAVIVSLAGVVNQQPLRTKDGGSAWNSFFFSLSALLVTYMPMFLIAPSTQTPLPTQ
ncbi:hypothetical protein AURDEDRAFT_158678 [Auricularia subglabra TFB-10046 SS5]|nr:hypothetical protein AURDEDRAFT_158678 [Auricularia subglabra TFB-10046 SS5]